MNISCRIANADTQCGRITNPPERSLPHSHSNNGDFIYGHQFNVMKRLGYDYVDR